MKGDWIQRGIEANAIITVIFLLSVCPLDAQWKQDINKIQVPYQTIDIEKASLFISPPCA